ncbi:T9SS type B sorting domain-containing protein [Flavobacterium procerum]|uniref:T9SS type B sorting domain-containing protein n=1 Tax=Flavobacterium procerum TaxID=1455569 RepID=A0ABV6BZ23_9FLAO
MKQKLLFLFLLFSVICYSQENCNNGIDDDGDGLIDLNDSDCACNQSAINSIIPNPSFETKTGCPKSFSELYHATPWIQATSATTDYHNKCGFVAKGITELGLDTFPDGDGIASALFIQDWKEYLGATLLSPLKAETSYQLTFNVAAYFENGSGEFTGKDISLLEPVDITIYGCANGQNLPLNTYNSPDTADPTWVEIGKATYTPLSKWGELTITFKTNFDVNAIMLGAPKVLPASYLVRTNGNPYFLFDNLLLNTSAAFGVNISQQGFFCEENLVLKAEITKPLSSEKTFQWYQNGIAIVGATDETYKVPSFVTSLGQYSVKVTDKGSCFVSTKVTINNTIPGPAVTSVQPNCVVTTGSIKITTPAAEYSFDNGKTWQSSPNKELLAVGSYYVKIKTLSGCISSATGVNIVAPQLLANSNLTIVQPTTCDGKGSITVNAPNAVSYSFDNGVTWTTNATASDLEPGNYQVKIKDAVSCQSSAQYAVINRVYLNNPVFKIVQPSCGKGGQITVTTTADQYSFDNGTTWTTDPVATDLKAGSYLIKIKNNNGCQSNAAYANLEQYYLKFYPAYTKVQPICGTGGTITITSEAYEYSFDGGKTWSTDPVASDLLPGNYQIVCRNELGCISYPQYVYLDYFYLPNPAFTFTKPTCEIGGSITITTPATAYSFDNGNNWTTNPTATNLKAGTYYIMIKNEIGCTSSTYHYVNLDHFYLPKPSYVAVNPYCGNIGSIEITTKSDLYSFDGGYTWTTNPIKTNLKSGYYYIKIKNNLGCESNIADIYLDSNYLANPNYELTLATCEKNASITITTKSDFYSFDSGNTWTTNPTISDLPPNSYYNIRIKNSAGCISNYMPVSIRPFYLDNPAFTVVQPSCGIKGSITIETVADFYSIDNGSTWTTNPVFSNLTPNSYYYIKIKNKLGCTSEYQYIFIKPFFLDNPSYTFLQPSCGVAGNITITTPSDYYSFDNGSTWTTNPILSSPKPGSYYYILIKNNLGCTSSPLYIYVPPFYIDNPEFTVEQPSCGKGGVIAITTPADQYSFDGGNTWTTNSVASNLKAGYYYIMIKNKLGCVSNNQYAYMQAFYLDYPNYDVVQPTCESKGKITITTTADFYSFDNGNTWTTNPVLLNPSSNYTYIKIKNNKGCESNSQYVYVSSPFYISPKPNVTTVMPSNCGVKDGSITVTTSAASYSFDNGLTWKTNPNSGPLEAGTYAVKVKEYSSSCPSEANIVVLNSKNITEAPTFGTIQPTCITPTGSITVTTLASAYSFDNGLTWQSEKSKNNLQPGDYLVKIKNDKGCISESALVKIIPFTTYKITNYAVSEPLCASGSATGIVLKIETVAEAYSFDNGVTWSTNPVATNLNANTEYCLRIKNSEGCISEPLCIKTSSQIPVPPAPQITVKQPSGCESSGSISVNASKAAYSFDNGLTWVKNQTSTALTPGTYYIRTKEIGSECISEAAKAIIDLPPSAPKTPETIVVQPTTCSNPFGTIEITSLESGYSFDAGKTWTTNPKSEKLAAGTYFIKTKNSAGCESVSVTIKIEAPTDYPNAPTTVVIQPDCSNPQGKINITSIASAYSFDNGVTWKTVQVSEFLNPGDYYIKVKNADGCISEASKTVIIPFTNFPAMPTGSTVQTFCIDDNALIKNLAVSGASLKWYDAAVNGNLLTDTTLLEDGIYYGTQTINGCESKRFAITVKIQDTPFPIAESPQKFCIQQNATIAKIKINGQDIKWYTEPSGGINLAASTLLENGMIYYASQTINGCESLRFPVDIQIFEATTVECINFVEELPYPKFFTPNGDSYNDYWTIDFAYLAPNTPIRIYDRYGKLIKELVPNTSWDGTYLSHLAPSSDYWFVVTRLNGAEFRAHFSLKR